MSDLSKVKEINVVDDLAYANKHLVNGWILIAVNSVSGSDKPGSSSVSNEYVLGWQDALPAKHVAKENDDTAASKYAPQYDDYVAEKKLAKPKLKNKPKTITIID